VIRLALILSLIGATSVTPAQENQITPTLDHYLSAIVQVESGCVRRDLGQIEGTWRVGGDGELSCFQITPAVLRELGFGSKLRRVHSCPTLAESAARLHISLLQSQLPDARDWIAAWNGGLSGYGRKAPRRYADRVIALAQRLAQESAK
jgi:hypothetical protein